jgi:hypothetical protein
MKGHENRLICPIKELYFYTMPKIEDPESNPEIAP